MSKFLIYLLILSGLYGSFPYTQPDNNYLEGKYQNSHGFQGTVEK